MVTHQYIQITEIKSYDDGIHSNKNKLTVLQPNYIHLELKRKVIFIKENERSKNFDELIL